MALISTLNNQNNDLIELNRDSFNNQQAFNFNIPRGNNKSGDNSLNNELFNRKKISDDVISMSSASSSCASSPRGKQDYIKNMNNIYKNKVIKKSNRFDEDVVSKKSYKSYSSSYSNDSEESGDSSNSRHSKESYDSGKSEESGESVESCESGGESDESGRGERGDDGRIGNYNDKKKFLSPKELLKLEINEKREIIYQLDRLESKGFKLPFKFNMNSDLEEIKTEYNRIIREKELDGSVRFQQKMLMAFISGTEYLNSRYNPLSIRLDGWSEQVNENINDYDDIFEELHYKYKSTGKKMAPELRLFISLSGSAFMFHLTSRMFKDQPLPDIENVLKSDPELMKQFQNAAAKQYMMGNTIPQNVTNTSQYENVQQKNTGMSGMSDSMGIFGMVNNLFGSLTSDMTSRQPQSYQKQPISNNQAYNNTTEDIDNIIKNVHSKISAEDDFDNRIETLSVSDEEITSIIEDTADIHILKKTNAKRNKVNNDNKRTLNI